MNPLEKNHNGQCVVINTGGPVEKIAKNLSIRELNQRKSQTDIAFVINYFKWPGPNFVLQRNTWRFRCQNCNTNPIKGLVYKCGMCPQQYFCENCAKQHDKREETGHLPVLNCKTDQNMEPFCCMCYDYVYLDNMGECTVCGQKKMFCLKCLDKHTGQHRARKKTGHYNYTVIWAYVLDKATNKFAYVLEEEDAPRGNVDAHYYLKAYEDGVLVADWELESYNPYFGCTVYFLKWYEKENRIVLIYHGKHGTFCVSLKPLPRPQALGDPVCQKAVPHGSQPDKFRRGSPFSVYKCLSVKEIGGNWQRPWTIKEDETIVVCKDYKINLPFLKIPRKKHYVQQLRTLLCNSEHIPSYRPREQSVLDLDIERCDYFKGITKKQRKHHTSRLLDALDLN